jgi:hypothetical protein
MILGSVDNNAMSVSSRPDWNERIKKNGFRDFVRHDVNEICQIEYSRMVNRSLGLTCFKAYIRGTASADDH